MKAFLKIKNSEWVHNSNKEKIYEDEHGTKYRGPLIGYSVGETIIVEISDVPIDRYYRIIKVVGRIPPKK